MSPMQPALVYLAIYIEGWCQKDVNVDIIKVLIYADLFF
ncbi:hypothetical protein JCM19237_2015 [Photobacterium aphoticum]|uniref:Uncharacterized protein n=1 Tax=Photobacterium aphoticum TaxID=754436 RepID=A0A090QPW2_9GAMM|nr:hypothetical protein JCM19237_2015 [Photobacterium aphoticum]